MNNQPYYLAQDTLMDRVVLPHLKHQRLFKEGTEVHVTRLPNDIIYAEVLHYTGKWYTEVKEHQLYQVRASYSIGSKGAINTGERIK